MIETITSAQNPKVKLLLQLQQKSSERRKAGLFIVEGRRELMHCLEAGFEVDTVFCCPEVETGVEPMPTLPAGVRMFEVSKEVYDAYGAQAIAKQQFVEAIESDGVKE